jgi:hypothetical protein
VFSLGFTGPLLAQWCPPTPVSDRTPPGLLGITQPSNQMLIPRGVLAAACCGRCARELPRSGSRPPAAGLRRVCAAPCAPPPCPPSRPPPPTLPGLLSAHLGEGTVWCGTLHAARTWPLHTKHSNSMSARDIAAPCPRHAHCQCNSHAPPTTQARCALLRSTRHRLRATAIQKSRELLRVGRPHSEHRPRGAAGAGDHGRRQCAICTRYGAPDRGCAPSAFACV